jgi:hypothetical protein
MPASIQRNPDLEHLKILAILHYVLSGWTFLNGCFPLVYVGLGIAMVGGAMNGGPNPPPAEMGWFFTCLFGSITFVVWALGTLQIVAGRFLTSHRSYVLCFSAAVIDCITFPPMGTALGVFTIIVLVRPSVKALFEGIEYRDPRLAAFDDMDIDDMEPPPKPIAGPDDGSIREGDRMA